MKNNLPYRSILSGRTIEEQKTADREAFKAFVAFIVVVFGPGFVVLTLLLFGVM